MWMREEWAHAVAFWGSSTGHREVEDRREVKDRREEADDDEAQGEDSDDDEAQIGDPNRRRGH